MNILGGEYINKDNLPAWEKRKIQSYFLFKYTAETDKLTVWVWDPEVVRSAIRKGQVKGVVEKNSDRLTGGEELAKFLAADGDKLFFPAKEDHQIEFTRIK